ncbi:MAG: HlyD family efflux transporter periplasmic adaptor subunit [Phycisphaerales bacterium]|nr:MAG: HlyD family efflux transporter periplasmic adaptor subunit [Phycisphaerales bacterium]
MSKRNTVHHVLQVGVWLVAVAIVIGLFRQRTQRFQVVGIAQGQVRQVATNCAGRIMSVSPQLFDRVAAGQVVAVVDTVLDNEHQEEVLRAQLSTISAKIAQLAAQLVPIQDELRASQVDRETNRIADLRQFTLDVETARLRILQLKAQLAQDRMALADLAGAMKEAEELVEKKAVAPLEYERAKAQHDALAQTIVENVHLLEETETTLAQAQERLDDYASRETFNPSAESALEPTRKEIAVQEGLMQEVSAQLNAIEQQRALELTSPVDGMVSQVWRAPGEAVTAGEPILTITVTRPTEVIGYATQDQLGRVRENMVVEVARINAPAQAATSRVTYVGPAVVQMPEQLWQNPAMPQYGRPFKVKLPPELAVIPGEVVGIRGL